METAPFKLASHRSSGGEGDHEVVEGGADWRHYKNCGEAATATL